jgi:hypothetical protein
MKWFLVAVALASAFVCTAAHAATITTTQNGSAHSLYLNGETDVFDTVEVVVTPEPGNTFTPRSGIEPGVPRPPGQPFTYLNRVLNGDPLDDPSFLGWSILGLTITANEFKFTGGPLGQTIETNGDLFLANLNFGSPSGRATAVVKTYRIGNVVADLSLTFPIPEPAALALAVMGLAGLVAASRRKS